MNPNVVSAIFRRNFNSYFSNPTGYVFICVYVLLSSFAAFWPNEFFNDNLANLDQLNKYLPFILLVFIPAITMSVWSEERRQGTDELLLTIPAGDFDVVLGKYLAAVAIYSVALAFSGLCNFAILSWLGNPDLGLFIGTYFGYWLVGAAMLSIGMAASFLTGNLTVGFVLGAMFNAPLAFAENADVIFPASWALEIKNWSLSEQFRDFGRGVISLSGVAYFLAIVAAMLYLCMVLIGRRHWQGGRDGHSMGGHFLLRTLALAAIAVGVTMTFHRFDTRADVTSERLSSLSSQTRKLIKELDPKRPVTIDAYVSPDVPESYVQTRLDLLSTLRELDSLGGNTVKVVVHSTKPLSEEAEQAEQQFGIAPQMVTSRSRGAVNREQMFLGVAIQAGLNKVVVPFFDRGIPVEYELIRSICTVAQQERKKVGVLVTDAKLFGGFNMQNFSQTRNEMLIDELEKQYDVVQVNADSPIEENLDVLMAPQPSSLGPEQMKNFVAAVKKGIPTAIFEDPFPAMHFQEVPGTSMPRRPQQQNPFGGGPPPQPKGNINELWNLLGVDFVGADVIWQLYNPEPKLRAVSTREWVWVDNGASADWVFNPEDRVASQLQEVLFLFPGAVAHKNASQLKFASLVKTGDETGTVLADEIFRQGMFGQGGGLNPDRRYKQTNRYYTVAARITGTLKEEEELMSDAPAEPAEEPGEKAAEDTAAEDTAAEDTAAEDSATEDKESGDKAAEDKAAESDEAKQDAAAEKKSQEDAGEDEAKAKPKREGINVILVCDTDVFYSEFFTLRAMGNNPDQEFHLNLDNVTFVLNVLDDLAGDERFIEVRGRRPKHRILKRIEDLTQKAREDNIAQTQRFSDEFEAEKAKAQQEFEKEIDDLRKKSKDLDEITLAQLMAMKQETGTRKLQTKMGQLKKAYDKNVAASERELNRQISRVQDSYKMWAVLLPPIPPLLVGLGVYFNRRAREREGVSKARLR